MSEPTLYGIGYTDNGNPDGKILSWKRTGAHPDTWEDQDAALKACEMDGWRGYVFSYPDGTRPPRGWGS